MVDGNDDDDRISGDRTAGGVTGANTGSSGGEGGRSAESPECPDEEFKHYMKHSKTNKTDKMCTARNTPPGMFPLPFQLCPGES